MPDTTKPTGKRPTHHAFYVIEREGKDSIWTRIGNAWTHNDGKGFNIQLNLLPPDGRVTLRVPSEDKA